MSESQTAVHIFNLKFANINVPRVRKRKPHGEIWTLSMNKKILFLPLKDYFQGNSEARRTEITQKCRGIGFQDNRNLSSLLIFDGNIKSHNCSIKTYLGIGLGY